MLKSLFSLYLLSLCLLGNSQSKTLIIIDEETNIPVPFAHLKIIGKDTAFLTNFEGKYTFGFPLGLTDSILVTCISYTPQYHHLTHNQVTDTIHLFKQDQILNTVEVNAKMKYKYHKLGNTKSTDDGRISKNFFGNTGDISAVWIPNPYSIRGYIKGLNIYLTQYGYPQSHFRVHLYKADAIEIKPGQEITSENIVVKGEKGQNWQYIDLEHLYLPVTENGFFVGIEWFSKDTNILYNDTVTYQTSLDSHLTVVHNGSGAVIGTCFEQYKNAKYKSWILLPDGSWDLKYKTDESRFYVPYQLPSGHENTLTENNLYFPVASIYANVKYLKYKQSKDFKLPQKAKLNRLEKVKQNRFLYPQNSILELFNSLIKAFENNDIIYAMKYLFIFKEDEFKTILQDIKSKGIETYISEKERLQIIASLTKVRDRLGSIDLEKNGDHYQIEINGANYALISQNGLWRINPYEDKLIK